MFSFGIYSAPTKEGVKHHFVSSIVQRFLDCCLVLVVWPSIQQIFKAQKRIKERAAFFMSFRTCIRIGADTGAAGWALNGGMVLVILFVPLNAGIDVGPFPGLGYVVRRNTGIGLAKNADDEAFRTCDGLELFGESFPEFVVSDGPCAGVYSRRRNFNAHAFAALAGFSTPRIALRAVGFVCHLAICTDFARIVVVGECCLPWSRITLGFASVLR